MHVTHDIAEAAYDYLRATPPFAGWRLPAPDDVEFRIIRNQTDRGWYKRGPAGEHIIGLSNRWLSLTQTVMATMAHEMIHMRQSIAKTETPGAEHNAEFWRLTQLVARQHGFDPRWF